MTFEAHGGDVADWYYKLRMAHHVWKFIALEDITVHDLFACIKNLGFEPDFASDDGPFLAVAVFLIGWKWPVVLAQQCLEDLMDKVGGNLAQDRRIIQNVLAPSFLFGRCWTRCGMGLHRRLWHTWLPAQGSGIRAIGSLYGHEERVAAVWVRGPLGTVGRDHRVWALLQKPNWQSKCCPDWSRPVETPLGWVEGRRRLICRPRNCRSFALFDEIMANCFAEETHLRRKPAQVGNNTLTGVVSLCGHRSTVNILVQFEQYMLGEFWSLPAVEKRSQLKHQCVSPSGSGNKIAQKVQRPRSWLKQALTLTAGNGTCSKL